MPSSVADLAALGKLFEEQRPRLLAMLQRRIDPALAVRIAPEDILGEAFLQARRKWLQFKEKANLTPSVCVGDLAARGNSVIDDYLRRYPHLAVRIREIVRVQEALEAAWAVSRKPGRNT